MHSDVTILYTVCKLLGGHNVARVTQAHNLELSKSEYLGTVGILLEFCKLDTLSITQTTPIKHCTLPVTANSNRALNELKLDRNLRQLRKLELKA